MLLKECTYSLMVDYDGLSFQEVLVSRGGDKGDIARITKLELVLRCINNCELNSQWNPCICPTECMRSKVVLLNEASDTFLQLIYGCVALPF